MEVINIFSILKFPALNIKDAMQHRTNKDSEFVVKIAINLALNISYDSAKKLMVDHGISETIIERILYDPNNIRKTDLKDFSSC